MTPPPRRVLFHAVRSLLLWLLLVFALSSALEWWLFRDQIGRPLPAYIGTTVQGEAVDWRRDPPRLIYVWAEWCGVCQTQRPWVEALGRGYELQTLAMQSGEAPAVSAYLTHNGLDWPTLVDPRGELAQRLGVKAVPALLIVSPNGEVRWVMRGLSSPWGVRLRLWWLGDA